MREGAGKVLVYGEREVSAIFVYVCMTMLLPMCTRQGASHWARRQTGGLRPGPVADRGPQTGPGGRQGASDQARRQTGGLRLGLAADREPQTGPGGRG